MVHETIIGSKNLPSCEIVYSTSSFLHRVYTFIYFQMVWFRREGLQ